MIKTTALVCAAMMTFTVSAFSMHKAGWFSGKPSRIAETRQVLNNDRYHSEAALRFRHNQNMNWRLAMAIR
jgi:hypothetical protein